MQNYQETTLREDISLFHAALQSALSDPGVNELLQSPARTPALTEGLDKEHLGIVEDYKSHNLVLPAGTDLYREGDTCEELYILLDGWVSLSRGLENGRRLILNFMLPGSFPGFQANLLPPMENTAQCVTAAVVCVFQRDEFTRLLNEHSPLELSLALSKAADEKKMQDNLINIAMRPARARLAHFLIDLHTRAVQAFPEQEATDINLPLTQQDIADALGLSVVHINRAFRALHRESVAAFKKNRLRILDFQKLQAIATLSDS